MLHWVFHNTTIPTIISSQEGGLLLKVEGFGDYQVEWHMVGDLKTLKCMYNISRGSTAKSPCLYCMSCAKDFQASKWNKAPDRHLEDSTFHAILNIPLSELHVCTLHALYRIIEKIICLYIGFAWKLRPAKAKEEAIHKIEAVLSEIGLHGGNVKIEVGLNKLGNGDLVLIKPSKLEV